jgi:hypothetical protein
LWIGVAGIFGLIFALFLINADLLPPHKNRRGGVENEAVDKRAAVCREGTVTSLIGISLASLIGILYDLMSLPGVQRDFRVTSTLEIRFDISWGSR